MNFAAILDVVTKGLTVAETLISAGKSAGPAIAVLKNFVSKGESVTQADIDATSARLDSQIEEFNRE